VTGDGGVQAATKAAMAANANFRIVVILRAARIRTAS
jgi:hypothetical protein